LLIGFSTDVSFAAMLQKNAEEVLNKSGILLSADETCALKKVLAASSNLLWRYRHYCP
jgi:hypothetical protein